MDAFKEFQGKTIALAVEAACRYFSCSRQDLEMEVLRDAKSGIFGIVRQCDASIRARAGQSAACRGVPLQEDDADTETECPALSPEEHEKRISLQNDAKRPLARSRRNVSERRGRKQISGKCSPSPENPAPKGRRTNLPVSDLSDGPLPVPSITEDTSPCFSAPSSPVPDELPRSPKPSRPRLLRPMAKKSREGRSVRMKPSQKEIPSAFGSLSTSPSSHAGILSSSTLLTRSSLPSESSFSCPPNSDVPAGPSSDPVAERSGLSDSSLGLFSPCCESVGESPLLSLPSDLDGLPEDMIEGLPLLPEAELASPEFQAFLLDVLERLIRPIVGNEVKLETEIFKSRVRVHIESGEHSGLLIGRDGQTLAAVQYLATRILTQKFGCAVRLALDAGEYRVRQEEKLHEMALSLAERARETGRSYSTKPLSSYHRRLVHLALKNEPDIHSRSIGPGSMKRVVITYKKGIDIASDGDIPS
ncbi:MAG: Jag N-terminal domain-containing protein [Desulfovibrio sp.]|nr:Jag N-terminal domain-containing protein [Desulfovibrio sp.]